MLITLPHNVTEVFDEFPTLEEVVFVRTNCFLDPLSDWRLNMVASEESVVDQPFPNLRVISVPKSKMERDARDIWKNHMSDVDRLKMGILEFGELKTTLTLKRGGG